MNPLNPLNPATPMNIAFPLRVDARGRTATATLGENLRQMIELVLFTSPGERLNRPDFGAGLLDLVFSPNRAAGVAADLALITSSLERWLGDVLSVDEVAVEAEDATVRILVRYTDRTSGAAHEAQFIAGPT